jgi:hypothetical protein
VARLIRAPKTAYDAKKKILSSGISVDWAWVHDNQQAIEEAETAREVDIIMRKFVQARLIEVPGIAVSADVFHNLARC